MIINASGGNADAVMTVAQTLSDTQKAQARTNIGALSSANGAVAAANLASNAVETAKIKDAAVSRAKLANDALCSPIVFTATNRNVSVSDLGKTIAPQMGSAGVALVTYTVSQSLSAALPNGFEVALAQCWTNNKMNIAFSGVRVMTLNDGLIASASHAATVTIAGQGGMVALKKLVTDATNGDYWLLTGPAEVV